MIEGPIVRPTGDGSQTAMDAATGRNLVVLDPVDPAGTLQAALHDSATADGDLDLLLVVPTAEYERRRRDRIDAGVSGPYSIDHLEEEARRIARRAGHEVLDTEDAEFVAMGSVGRPRDRIREAVAEHGYERVYVPPERRSVLERLLGGSDLAAALPRALPDGVTVVTAGVTVEPAGGESGSGAGLVSAVRRAVRLGQS